MRVCVIPLNANGQLPRARDRLDDDVALRDAAGQQLGLGTLQQRVNDLGVPSRVHDADAQAGAVVLLGGGALHGVLVGWWMARCEEEGGSLGDREGEG